MSTIIQRSVSERSREKCLRLRTDSHAAAECPRRPRRIRECRHTESKLRQQARLEYVQSTPNVATIHNNKFGSANPRDSGGSGGIDGNGAGTGAGIGLGISGGVGGSVATSADVVGGSTVNVSKMYSAVSDGELLDVTILPIFQKLLTERHKSSRGGYGASVASCPNISIKCDIVEYL